MTVEKVGSITITLSCTNCGSSILEVADENDDDAVVVCRNCGTTHGRWGEVKAKEFELAAAEGKKVVAEELSKVIRRMNNRFL